MVSFINLPILFSNAHSIGLGLLCYLSEHVLDMWILGSWKFLDSTNSSSKFPDLKKSNGDSVIELFSRPTKINGVHYVQVRVYFFPIQRLNSRVFTPGKKQFLIDSNVFGSSRYGHGFKKENFYILLLVVLTTGCNNFPWCVQQWTQCWWCSNKGRRCLYMAFKTTSNGN